MAHPVTTHTLKHNTQNIPNTACILNADLTATVKHTRRFLKLRGPKLIYLCNKFITRVKPED